jgi:putative ABC transport system permease protein
MGFFQDLRGSIRMLRKSPGFVTVAVLTLGIGIGANTIIFSLAQALFLRAMSFPDGERLTFVSRGYPGYPQGGGNFTYPAYRDMIQQNNSFDTLAAFQSFGALALTDGAEPVRVNINYITPSYFDLLGTKMQVGRKFRAEENRWGDADPVIVLSHGFWQREFGSASDIVGRTIHLNQQALTVVGVAEENFRDAPGEIDNGEAVDAWIPLGLSNRLTGLSDLNNRNAAILWGIGHLKPGVTLAQAKADFSSINKRMTEQYPSTDSGFTLVVDRLKDRLVGQFYNPVWLLIGGSVFVLMIGCANVANLLLARLVARQRELAVRGALGATGLRLAQQMLAENLLLVLMAAGLGVGIATGGLKALHNWGQAYLPSALQVSVDHWMLAGSVLASGLTLMLFGLGPAIVGSRVDLRDALNQSGRQGVSLRRRRAANLLIVSEVSLALVLLVGAGLLLKSFHRLTTIDLGFTTRNLLTLRIDLNADKYTPPEVRTQFAKNLADKLNTLPGVKSATIWGPGMPGRETWVVEAIPEGRPHDDPKSIVMSTRHSVNPGALANMGISILRGRDFTWHDDLSTPLVTIVSESSARAMWPGEDPIGKRFSPIGTNKGLITVVGVAADARLRQRLDMSDASIGIPPGGLGPQLDVYLPYAQRANRSMVVAVRTQGDTKAVTNAIRSAVLGMDSTLPVYDVALLDDRLAAQDGASRALTVVTGGYALLALFLASLGLFGVLAHAVSRRTQELGVRMALGAKRRDLLVMVLREGVTLTVTGLLCGLIGAALLTRMMASLLFGVNSTDPGIYAGISLLLLTVALAACYLPARRATKVDPMVALRYE